MLVGRGGTVAPGRPEVGSGVTLKLIVGVMPGVTPNPGVVVSPAVAPGVNRGVTGKLVRFGEGVA